MTFYIGLIHKEPRSVFGISFPDFPGCISAGDTLEEAVNSGGEALTFHIEGMLLDGQTIPAPRRAEDIVNDPNFTDGVPVLVQVETPFQKAA